MSYKKIKLSIMDFFMKYRKNEFLRIVLFSIGLIFFAIFTIIYYFEKFYEWTRYKMYSMARLNDEFQLIEWEIKNKAKFEKQTGRSPTYIDAMSACFTHYRMKLFFIHSPLNMQKQIANYCHPALLEYLIFGLPEKLREKLTEGRCTEYKKQIAELDAVREFDYSFIFLCCLLIIGGAFISIWLSIALAFLTFGLLWKFVKTFQKNKTFFI